MVRRPFCYRNFRNRFGAVTEEKGEPRQLQNSIPLADLALFCPKSPLKKDDLWRIVVATHHVVRDPLKELLIIPQRNRHIVIKLDQSPTQHHPWSTRDFWFFKFDESFFTNFNHS
jgi:hypothetical protein